MPGQNECRPLPACPVETTLTLIGDKWKVLILRDLLTGTKRFGELKRSLGGVSQKVLRTRSGSAWNLVQKLLKRPRFARLGTKIASHAPMRESAWPM